MLDIIPLPAFSDNYIWLIKPKEQSSVYVVDPGDALSVIDYLESHGLTLRGILITHHHSDHTDGIAALIQYAKNEVSVYGPASENIQGVTEAIVDEGKIDLKEINLSAEVMKVPGHTAGHIAYLIEDKLFCGDTLFSGGCGRLFEGTPRQMQTSLGRFKALPASTLVYCTHEYTLANLEFAKRVNPGNRQLAEYSLRVEQMRLANQPSLPSNIGTELAINPFLRTDEAEIRESIALHFQQPIKDTCDSFALLRQWKDNF